LEKTIWEISFELAIVLFSVSLAWSFNALLNHYPRIHRFGHMWHPGKRKVHISVMSVSWFILIVATGWCVWSFWPLREFFSSKSLDSLRISDFINVSLIPFVYLFLPFFIARSIEGFIPSLQPDEFKKYWDDQERRTAYVLPRYSKDTAKTLYTNRWRGSIMGIESLALMAWTLWLITQCLPCWGMWAPITALISAWALHWPYGWRPRDKT